jgi:hypothetical protein
MRYVREVQDNQMPTCGYVFSRHFRLGPQLMAVAWRTVLGSPTKLQNWILNTGEATCEDVLRLIRWARQQHLSAFAVLRAGMDSP